MPTKYKYILSIIAGFLAILLMGVAAIKLMKAKRSSAPETENVSIQNISRSGHGVTETSEITWSSKPIKEIPTEQSVASALFVDIPQDARLALASFAPDAAVYKITYTDGSIGYRFEVERGEDMDDLYRRLHAAEFQGWEWVKDGTYRDLNRAIIERYKNGVRVVLHLQRVSDGLTGVGGYIFQE